MSQQLSSYTINPLLRRREIQGQVGLEEKKIHIIRETQDCLGVLIQDISQFSCTLPYIKKNVCTLVELLSLHKNRHIFFENVRVKSWAIPNLKVEDLMLTDIDKIGFESEVKLFQANKITMPIEYVINKSDGKPAKAISYLTDKWHWMIFYEGHFYYQGEGYKVGHIEVLEDVAVSTDVRGRIYLNGYFELKYKEKLTSPNLRLPYREGMIVMLYGTEYRIKRRPSWEMIVIDRTDSEYILSSAEGTYRRKYLIKQEYKVGEVVEVDNFEIIRKRDTSPSYEYQIIKILNSMPFAHVSLRILQEGEVVPRNRDEDSKIIIDEKMYQDIVQGIPLSEICKNNPDYRSRDILYTATMIGVRYYGLEMFNQDILSYDDFNNYSKMTKQMVIYANIDVIEERNEYADLQVCQEIVSMLIEEKSEKENIREIEEEQICEECFEELVQVYVTQLVLEEHREQVMNDNTVVRQSDSLRGIPYYEPGVGRVVLSDLNLSLPVIDKKFFRHYINKTLQYKFVTFRVKRYLKRNFLFSRKLGKKKKKKRFKFKR